MNDLAVINEKGKAVSCDHVQIDGDTLLLMDGNRNEREVIDKIPIDDAEIIASYYTDYSTIDHFRSGRNQK